MKKFITGRKKLVATLFAALLIALCSIGSCAKTTAGQEDRHVSADTKPEQVQTEQEQQSGQAQTEQEQPAEAAQPAQPEQTQAAQPDQTQAAQPEQINQDVATVGQTEESDDPDQEPADATQPEQIDQDIATVGQTEESDDPDQEPADATQPTAVEQPEWAALHEEFEALMKKKDTSDEEYYAVIQKLMDQPTSQRSPYMGEQEPLVRIFDGFVQIGKSGEIIAYQDSKALHLLGEGWECVAAYGYTSYDPTTQTTVWNPTGLRWAVYRRNGILYPFYLLSSEDVKKGDKVFDFCIKSCEFSLLEIMYNSVSAGEISETDFNILRAIQWNDQRVDIKTIQLSDTTEELMEDIPLNRFYTVNLISKEGKTSVVDQKKHSVLFVCEGNQIQVWFVNPNDSQPGKVEIE